MKFHKTCLIRCYKEDILYSSDEEVHERTITINPTLIPTIFERRKILLSKFFLFI